MREGCHDGAERIIIEWSGESWWSTVHHGQFENLPQYRSYKLDLLGASVTVSDHIVQGKRKRKKFVTLPPV